MQRNMLWSITHRFQCLSSSDGHVAHALRTLPPVADRVLLPLAAPRLACVKPAASVHPEPGSNSSLYISYFPGLVQFLELTLSIFSLFGTCFLYFPSVFSMISSSRFFLLIAVSLLVVRPVTTTRLLTLSSSGSLHSIKNKLRIFSA